MTAWVSANTSHTTSRNASRFVEVSGAGNGGGGVDFFHRISTETTGWRFFLESTGSGNPVSLYSTLNNPA